MSDYIKTAQTMIQRLYNEASAQESMEKRAIWPFRRQPWYNKRQLQQGATQAQLDDLMRKMYPPKKYMEFTSNLSDKDRANWIERGKRLYPTYMEQMQSLYTNQEPQEPLSVLTGTRDVLRAARKKERPSNNNPPTTMKRNK